MANLLFWLARTMAPAAGKASSGSRSLVAPSSNMTGANMDLDLLPVDFFQISCDNIRKVQSHLQGEDLHRVA
jgi:hypothetical protein